MSERRWKVSESRLIFIPDIPLIQPVHESFGATPSSSEADLRPLYCAFAISSMINDWSGVDIDKAIAYIHTCEVRTKARRLQPSYLNTQHLRATKAGTVKPHTVKPSVGNTPFDLSRANNDEPSPQGGTTYCALASLALVSRSPSVVEHVSARHRETTIWWLSQIQQQEGGFSGRTNKIADTCYCFWCGASLEVS